MGTPSVPLTFYQRDQIVLASWRNVGLAYWGAQATIRPTRKMGAMSAAMMNEYPKISMVQIIPDNVPMPDDEARDLFMKMTEVGGHAIACLAYVMSGEGFWASIMRSYLTNVHWVRHRPFIPRLCPTIDDVVAWMPSIHTEQTAVAVSGPELREALTACIAARTPAP